MPATHDTMTVADQTSQDFLGRWQRLISTTNWEKGRIIHEWRAALIKARADVTFYSDEAWAERVGHVTSQHVGRLRRTYERFGMVHGDYEGLFWSHYQAALDWHDAEMWLEGAVQNDWSVTAMRRQRAEAYGLQNDPATVAAEQAEAAEAWDNDEGKSEVEESLNGDGNSSASQAATSLPVNRVHDEFGGSSGPAFEGPDFGDESPAGHATTGSAGDAPWEDSAHLADDAATNNNEPVRPFAELPSLPDDLSAAFEELKLAILRHKVTNWQLVQPSEILSHLDALRVLIGQVSA